MLNLLNVWIVCSDSDNPFIAAKPAAAQKKASKDIWDEDEVNEVGEYDDIHDPRPSPE